MCRPNTFRNVQFPRTFFGFSTLIFGPNSFHENLNSIKYKLENFLKWLMYSQLLGVFLLWLRLLLLYYNCCALYGSCTPEVALVLLVSLPPQKFVRLWHLIVATAKKLE
jgi:hypothetical protein